MADGKKLLPAFFFALLGAVAADAQKTTNVTYDLNVTFDSRSTFEDVWVAQTGSVGSLGNAMLRMSVAGTLGDNGLPAQFIATLYFNALDTFSAVIPVTDASMLSMPLIETVSGPITSGTGAYAGATGSLSLTLGHSDGMTTGSGSLTVGAVTTPLKLTNFYGVGGSLATRVYDNASISHQRQGSYPR